MRTHDTSETGGFADMVRPVLTGVISGVLVCLVLMFAFAALMSANSLPMTFAAAFASCCSGLGSLIAGMVCAKKLKSRGLLAGLITGAVMYLILLLAGLIFTGGGMSSASLFRMMIVVICATIGGIMGVNFNFKIRRKT